MHAARLIAVCILLQAASGAYAHEFWIQPETFQPEAGAVVRIGLYLGERFAGQDVARDPDLIESFVVAGPAGVEPVIGRSGGKTNFARVTSPGWHVIGYRSRRSHNELPAGKFESYLREEGLEFVIPMRAQHGESGAAGREGYSRCAKALICGSGDCSAGFDRVMGYPLELVPLQNPFALGPGAGLTLRLLYHGAPLAGARLVAVDERQPHRLLAVTSDAQGEAEFRLEEPGVWMITTIHMVRAVDGLDAEWESFWASLTFEVGPGERHSGERSSPRTPIRGPESRARTAPAAIR